MISLLIATSLLTITAKSHFHNHDETNAPLSIIVRARLYFFNGTQVPYDEDMGRSGSDMYEEIKEEIEEWAKPALKRYGKPGKYFRLLRYGKVTVYTFNVQFPHDKLNNQHCVPQSEFKWMEQELSAHESVGYYAPEIAYKEGLYNFFYGNPRSNTVWSKPRLLEVAALVTDREEQPIRDIGGILDKVELKLPYQIDRSSLKRVSCPKIKASKSRNDVYVRMTLSINPKFGGKPSLHRCMNMRLTQRILYELATLNGTPYKLKDIVPL